MACVCVHPFGWRSQSFSNVTQKKYLEYTETSLGFLNHFFLLFILFAQSACYNALNMVGNHYIKMTVKTEMLPDSV